MSGQVIGIMIELIVAGLLAVTIGYCVVLNKRLVRLKADEQALRGTITELINATQIAERAIHGLKTTVRECDGTLGERLRTAERFLSALDHEKRGAEDLLDRISKIATAGRAATVAPTAPMAAKASPASATLAAASAFTSRSKLMGKNEAA